ncbi:transporter substrate-binding domain-containing protein [Nodosilinea nodulosa]|uniref:transporter substrate-binding domain-containing protein n=1 Tax=Nodosilinea nodulosa TaxID=416001 RepID=UPI000305AF6A|nr:transporter substrate-binding domain-containing protein [Nodosilinea nodulosa]
MTVFSMLYRRRWVCSALLAAGLAVGLAPLPGFGQTPATPGAALTMGTEADYVPFAYQYAADPPSGIVGFDIEVAKAIAQRLGFEISLQERPFEDLLPALQSGELDFAIAAITPTPERAALVDFSDSYFESRLALVSRRSHPLRTLTDLAGATIAVQSGSIQQQSALALQAAGTDIEIKAFDQVNEMVAAVRTQAVDVAFLEELVAEAYLENNPTLEFDVLGELPPMPVAIAFPKGSPYVEPFNRAIAELKASGELGLLARQWFTMQP